MNTSFDQESLLENVEGWVLSRIKEELTNSGGWEKLANLCVNRNGEHIFSVKDCNRFAQRDSPAEAFLNELQKRNVTMKTLCSLLEKAEMYKVLHTLGKEKKVELINQSSSGLVYLSTGEEFDVAVKTSGVPAPSFLWYKGKTPMHDQTSDTLHLKNFRVEDEGIYLCLVKQSLRNSECILWSAPVQLSVRECPPSFVRHPEGIEAMEGEKVDLSCEVESYPSSCFTWLKDGVPVARRVEDPTLQLENVRLSDCGLYQCIAKNPVGEAVSTPAALQVRPRIGSSSKPEIIHQPLLCEDQPKRCIGQQVTLLCSARCSENITFTWVVNGDPLQEACSSRHVIVTSPSSGPMFSSSLSYTVCEDDGSLLKVVCVVQSSAGSQVSNEVKVKVTPKKGPIEYKAGAKWALLIANTDYADRLYTPCSDLERLANELVDLNFHCLMMANLNLVELKNVVKLLSELIKPGDYVAFCYAGHGLFNGADLLIPIPELRTSQELDALPSVWVRATLQKNNPAMLFIVLDMCRHVYHAQVEGPLDVLKSVPKRNCVILNATSEGHQSLEDPRRSSILTSSLVKHLKDRVDVVSMARDVLRDVEHMSPYVRSEQIPTLDIDLCDARSLTDPQAFIDEEREKLWASLVSLPQKQVAKIVVEGSEANVRVRCSHGGSFRLITTVIIIQIEIVGTHGPAITSVAFNLPPEFIKPLLKSEKSFKYEIKAIHKMKEPLVLTMGFRGASGSIVEDKFHLGLPGVAEAKLYKDPFERSLRVVNTTHNIP